MITTIPEAVRNRPTDTVTYRVRAEKDPEPVQFKYICYNQHMTRLPEFEFRLEPDVYLCETPEKEPNAGRHWAVAGEVYLKFISLLQQNRAVPAECVASFDEHGLYMTIPRKGFSTHSVYSALCAYRWSESRAKMVYTAVRLAEERPDISFWQVMHYVWGHHIATDGHSWCSVLTTNFPYGLVTHLGGCYNLGNSLSAALFWVMSEEARSALGMKHNTGLYTHGTYSHVNEINRQIGGVVKGKYVLPRFLIDGSTDPDGLASVLDPKWTPLYRYAEEAGRAEVPYPEIGTRLTAMYDEAAAGDERVAELRAQIKKSFQEGW